MKLLLGTALLGLAAPRVGPADDPAASYAETFDAHWEALHDHYPYFDLYGVDWEAERDEHRPRALAAENDDEFAWELARLITALPDPHVSFVPAISTLAGRWSYPEIPTWRIGRRFYVLDWAGHAPDDLPAAFADDANACPEIVTIEGWPAVGVAEILVAGPLGTTFELGLRWPDGSETEHEFVRPPTSNLPPPDKHYGTDWLVVERVGSIGYLGVRTFSPQLATLGPDGKMTTMLRAALRELDDTTGLVLDFQGNGGGAVQASDPFLGNLIERSLGYRWGNSGGKRRVIQPRSPRYRQPVVVLVDGYSASGGEWAARILRDAERATIVGGRTAGAEAAVLTSNGPDGSVVSYSGWPMVEPGREPFQKVGLEPDHAFELTIEDVRAFGYEEARRRVRRARLRKALELLGDPEGDVGALCEVAERGMIRGL